MNYTKHLWNSVPHISETSYALTREWARNYYKKVADREKVFAAPNAMEISEDEFPEFERIISDLKSNPGFVLLKFGKEYSDLELRDLYLLCSRAIGKLNNRYGYFFDVIDQGLDYTKEAIPVSKTKASTGYHTDSTAKEYVPDVVGLLCLQPGFKGGESLITNAANAYEELRTHFPDALNELKKPVIRDVITPGTENNTEAILQNAFPVYEVGENQFSFRYMRYWIESAHAKTSNIIHSNLEVGLNAIDAFFSRPSNAVAFRMERGDMLFLNNRFLCHNRTAFENHKDFGARTMVRVWINFEK